MAGRESSWREEAESSILLKAVSHWREDPGAWFEKSYSRLFETVRVNPHSPDKDWVEGWLEGMGSSRIPWFSGPGSAWEMPFERGSAEGEERLVLTALHDTGRITRQEAVSMLPVLALDPRPGEVVLDMCASPGSKTTQICEHLGDSGAVIANEVISGRVNTLVTNVQRHASRPTVVVQHDGRHIPKVPERGFDRVLVDVPCTGSGTTRKNPDVWGKWLPSSGHSMHELQHDLLSRAIKVAKPGGRIVYSTCSLDPVENEAVVARVLESGVAKVVKAHDLLPEVPSDQGMTVWPTLDDSGRVIDDPVLEFLIPPREASVASQLESCMRVWNDSVGGGGFFLAVLEKAAESGRGVAARPPSGPRVNPLEDPASSPLPIAGELASLLEESWGSVPSNMWHRGKSILWSTDEVRGVWDSERSRKGGRELVPGGRWRPLNVIHLGLISARVRKGELERVVSKAAHRLSGEISGPYIEVGSDLLEEILLGNEPSAEALGPLAGEIRGSRVLVDESGFCLSVWVGNRVTPMISESEKTVMRATRGLSIALREEE